MLAKCWQVCRKHPSLAIYPLWCPKYTEQVSRTSVQNSQNTQTGHPQREHITISHELRALARTVTAQTDPQYSKKHIYRAAYQPT